MSILVALILIVAFLFVRNGYVWISALYSAGVFRVKWVNYRALLLLWLSERFRLFSVYLANVALRITTQYLNKYGNGKRP